LLSNFCTLSNDQESDIRVHTINIPNTTTIIKIIYCPGLPIERAFLDHTITAARLHMIDKLNRFGDSPLMAVDDPYNS